MSEEKKYNYTGADIEKYHKGLLSPKEMNELEKAALDDPLLADALEGYSKMPVNVAADMEELEIKLEQRVSGAKIVPLTPGFNVYRLLKVAAVIVFVAGSAFLIYKLAFDQSDKSMAIDVLPNPSNQKQVANDSIKKVPVDSISKASNANTEFVIVEKQSARKKDSLQSSTLVGVNAKTGIDQSIVSEKATATDVLKSSTYTWVTPDTLKNSPPFKSADDSRSVTREVHIADGYYNQKSEPATRKAKQAEPSAVTSNAVGVNDNFYRDKETIAKTNFFRGRVMDNNNNALPFANISNVKDNVGTYADAQGNFTLISSDSIMNVRVKSVGFNTDTLQLRGDLSYNKIVLKEDVVQGVVLGGKRQGKIPSPEQNIQVEESEPADGWNNYNIYMANNIKIPGELKQKTAGQEVKLSFEVNKLGEPINIKVENSNCKECNEEAIRLVKEGPKWKPKKRKSRVTLTVPF